MNKGWIVLAVALMVGCTSSEADEPYVCGEDTYDPDEVVGGSDPTGGVFSMEDALMDLPAGDGDLRAILTTPAGDITCVLEPDHAPIGVANFVGLARGSRPWLDPAQSQWVQRRFYDGLLFHRIIDDFMAQGGDPLGTGMGGPGYAIIDEISTLTHGEGTLAYANAGPNTSGSQFYITEIATSWLDGGYTILGECSPMSAIQALAATPTDGSDRPLEDTVMSRVEITRCE